MIELYKKFDLQNPSPKSYLKVTYIADEYILYIDALIQ